MGRKIKERIGEIEKAVRGRGDGGPEALFINRIGADGIIPADGYSTPGLPPIFRQPEESDDALEQRCLAAAKEIIKTGVVVFKTISQNSKEV